MSDNVFTKLMGSFDKATETAARSSAQLIGRRSALASIGTALIGGTLLPVLPFDRSGRALAADPASIESSRFEVRLLALLRARRLPLLLLRRERYRLSAGRRALGGDLGRHLPQLQRRQRLSNLLQ